MDINQLNEIIEKSKKIGLTELPKSNRNNIELEKVLMEIFDTSSLMYFRSKDLKKLFVDGGIDVSKIGHVLYAMTVKDKIENPKNGIYRAKPTIQKNNSAIIKKDLRSRIKHALIFRFYPLCFLKPYVCTTLRES